MNRERQGFHISHVYSLWRDLSRHSIILDLATLTLRFDLLFKNFNPGYNFLTNRCLAFIFYIYIPNYETFSVISTFLVRRDESPENYCHSPVRRQKL